MKEIDYYDKELAVPAYDIEKNAFLFRFRNEYYKLYQGKCGFDHHALEYGPDGFKVMHIDKVKEMFGKQNG